MMHHVGTLNYRGISRVRKWEKQMGWSKTEQGGCVWTTDICDYKKKQYTRCNHSNDKSVTQTQPLGLKVSVSVWFCRMTVRQGPDSVTTLSDWVEFGLKCAALYCRREQQTLQTLRLSTLTIKSESRKWLVLKKKTTRSFASKTKGLIMLHRKV